MRAIGKKYKSYPDAAADATCVQPFRIFLRAILFPSLRSLPLGFLSLFVIRRGRKIGPGKTPVGPSTPLVLNVTSGKRRGARPSLSTLIEFCETVLNFPFQTLRFKAVGIKGLVPKEFYSENSIEFKQDAG